MDSPLDVHNIIFLESREIDFYGGEIEYLKSRETFKYESSSNLEFRQDDNYNE